MRGKHYFDNEKQAIFEDQQALESWLRRMDPSGFPDPQRQAWETYLANTDSLVA